jgi:hypothetical protein
MSIDISLFLMGLVVLSLGFKSAKYFFPYNLVLTFVGGIMIGYYGHVLISFYFGH